MSVIPTVTEKFEGAGTQTIVPPAPTPGNSLLVITGAPDLPAQALLGILGSILHNGKNRTNASQYSEFEIESVNGTVVQTSSIMPNMIDHQGATDTVQIGVGPPTLSGGLQDATHDGAGHMTLPGGQGDTLLGGWATPPLPTAGSDTLFGAAGHSTLAGGQGDTLLGAAGHTTVAGGPSDTLFGAAGHSTLAGGQRDTLLGAVGHTTVAGGPSDTLSGAAGHSTLAGGEADTLSGWESGDKSQFAGQNATTIDAVVAKAHVVGGNTVLVMPDGSTITLIGVSHVTPNFFG